MFERFTERARKVVVLAQEEARHFNHNYIGTEHVAVGLVREGHGLAGRVLDSLGVDLAKSRSALEHIVGRGDSPVPPVEIVLTPRAKRLFEFALDEAQKLGHPCVSTEHLLLGIVRDATGIGSAILESQGATMDKVRAAVENAIRQGGQPPASPA